jgi:hypothetical protein
VKAKLAYQRAASRAPRRAGNGSPNRNGVVRPALPETSSAFGAPRFRALYRQCLDDPDTLWIAGSHTTADALKLDHGRVECVELSRQYLHLSPLIDVDLTATAGDDLGDDLGKAGRPLVDQLKTRVSTTKEGAVV